MAVIHNSEEEYCTQFNIYNSLPCLVSLHPMSPEGPHGTLYTEVRKRVKTGRNGILFHWRCTYSSIAMKQERLCTCISLGVVYMETLNFVGC